MNFFKKLLVVSIMECFLVSAHAEMTIEITRDIENSVPISVVPFAKQSAPVNIGDIVNSDLGNSGYFRTLNPSNMPSQPNSPEAIRFPDWQTLGQKYIVIGQVADAGAGQYNVQFQVFDVTNGQQVLGYKMGSSAQDLRRTAHHISDLIYEKLTGKKGVFGGRIAYITSIRQGDDMLHKLIIADADGANARAITSSIEPLMSPAWSPDAKHIAYVSFERKTAAIYIQTLATGERRRVAEFPGINGAPAWSPDGTRLALTLSKDGSPDIFVLNLNSGQLTKLTRGYSIDTEPTWSPDGGTIVYTSDKGGKPQLYSVPSNGGEEKRLTFSGSYNARASFSPDGKYITMVHGGNGGYRIAVMNTVSGTINVLTPGPLDESPSFAPNGEAILYASRHGKLAHLSAVSIDGRMQQKLTFDSSEVREPAWSPR